MKFCCHQKDTANLPDSKNHFASDICIDKDTPVFATSKDVIKFIGQCTTTDEIANDMMAVRWHVFNFTQPIACDKQKDVPPCSKCFPALIQLGSQLKIYTL